MTYFKEREGGGTERIAVAQYDGVQKTPRRHLTQLTFEPKAPWSARPHR